MSIQVLPENLVKRIAAGEVIERPVSVVKELIENSIDAGATRIEVKIEEGGIANITVIDNGCGISKEDIPKMLHRHSTSKILSEDDLESILTLGFRGEALYSIASVTKLRIRTRCKGENEGSELVSEGGKVSVNTISAPEGTTIEASGLFYNTPARFKFLKSASSEYQRIAEVVSRYVLAYPEISFELNHNGRNTLKSLGGSPQDPLIALWGAKVTSRMLPIDFRAGEVHVSGFVSSPEVSRGTRKDISVFINGRLIWDSMILTAIERPFVNVLPPGRHPVAIVKIAMSPQDVDVNVHPNKREVRLANPKEIFGDVHVAVDRALSMHEPLKSPGQETLLIDSEGEVRRTFRGSFGRRTDTAFQPTTEYLPPEVIYTDQERSGEAEPLFKGEIAPRSVRRGEVVEYLDTYVVFELGDDLVIVDFHNLHERILFEQMLDAAERKNDGVLSQKLMFPESFTLPPDLAQIVETEGEFINRMGFEIEPFGDGAFIVRSVPHFLKDSNPAETVLDILVEVSEEAGKNPSPVDLKRQFMASAACKAAVKAGSKLKPEEIDFIIRNAGDARYMTCPHGRPTMIKLDRDFFDKRFKRKSWR
ncbi:MAG: DNA mismatch repair endonuclease MutL [bacterium]